MRNLAFPIVVNGENVINIVNMNESMNFVGLCLDYQLEREKTPKAKDRDVFEASL